MEFSMWLKENLFEVGTFYLLLCVYPLLSNKCTSKFVRTGATGSVPPSPAVRAAAVLHSRCAVLSTSSQLAPRGACFQRLHVSEWQHGEKPGWISGEKFCHQSPITRIPPVIKSQMEENSFKELNVFFMHHSWDDLAWGTLRRSSDAQERTWTLMDAA